MKVRQLQARVLGVGVLSFAAAFTAPASEAQARGQAQPPRLMVPVFRSGDKALGVQAGDALRSRLEGDYPQRVLFVVPKTDYVNALSQSGYPADEALSSLDLKQLAVILKAEEYLEGNVQRTANGGVRVNARLLLSRDNSVAQPLEPAEGAKVNDAMNALSRSIRDARKQLEDEKECYLNQRLRKYDDAVKKAREGVKKYPRATMARLCMLGTYRDMKKPLEEQLQVATEILAIDSLSKPALTVAAEAYKAKGDTTNYFRTLAQLVSADPGNAVLVNQVVNELASAKRANLASPLVRDAIKNNPGDAQLLRTGWLVFLAADEYKEAIATGEELVRVDTAAADTGFFLRMAGAYQADSNMQKMTETLARGTAKFPNNAALWLFLGQSQRRAGQTQQSIESIRKAMSIDPKVENGSLLLAQSFVELNQPDSALVYVRQGAASGQDKAALGQFATSLANTAYRAANGTKARPDFLKAMAIAQFADSLAPGDTPKFLTGASAVSAAVSALQEASQTKKCEPAKQSADLFEIAQVNVPAGGKVNAQAAGQLMQIVQQYGPTAQKLKAQLCK